MLKLFRWLAWQFCPIEVQALNDFVRVYLGAKSTSPVTIKVVMDVQIPPGNTIGGVHGIPAPSTVQYGIRVKAVTPDDRPIVYNHFHNKCTAADSAYLLEEARQMAFGLGDDLPKASITVMSLEGETVHQREAPVEAG